MARYIQVKTEDGYEFVRAEEYVPPERKAPYVIGDLQPYRPVAGDEGRKFFDDPKNARLIGGRRQHREFLRRNNLIEVGNEMRPETVKKYHGKTEENYKRFNERKYRGHDVSEIAKQTPVAWQDPDIDRLKR